LARIFLGGIFLGCNAAPVDLQFVSGGTGDRLDGDRVIDAALPEAASQPEASPPTPPPETPADPVQGFQPGPECDAFPSACADAERPKCTLISNDPGYRSSCVVERGMLAIGAACQRRVRGDDDCAPGGFCSAIGESFENDNRLVCKQLCSSSEQCGSSERCLQLLGDGPLGVCVEECPLFDDAACGSDELRCAAAAEAGGAFFAYCEIYGGLDDGAPCTLSSQCRSGLSCELDSQSCRYSCDDEHRCPDELRCVPLELGKPDAFRLCVP
jgi:hypothetical protein